MTPASSLEEFEREASRHPVFLVQPAAPAALDAARALLKKAAEAEDSGRGISPALQRQMSDPVLLTSISTAGLVGLGVVFLMTTKPDLIGSLIALAVAAVLGVLLAQLWPRPRAGQGLPQEAEPRLAASSD